MKKVLATLCIIIGVIILLLLAIPLFFKGNIAGIIEKQSAKYIRADLQIGDLSLSMFKSFPNLNVELKNTYIIGKETFAGDTLANIPLFSASVNLMSLIKGKEIIINRVLLEDCLVKPTITADGKANWDILLSKDTTSSVQSAPKGEENEGSIKFNDIVIRHLSLVYNDYQTSGYASVEGIDLSLSGNFSETNTLLNLILSLNNISFRQGNNVWLNQTDLYWETDIDANLKDLNFHIRKSDLAINDLKLDVTGSIAIDPAQEKYNVDLNLNAPDTKFESLLALIPKSMQKHIEGLETSGNFTLSLTAKGEYYKDHLPATDLKFAISKARVKYPDLPESIENINLTLDVTNPGGSPDLTVFDLSQMSFTMAGNPFYVNLKIENPNDPFINGSAKGTIDFNSLKKALPLKDMTLQGKVNADLTFNGKYQYIEKKQYERFTAKGNILLSNILIKNTSFPEGISIPQGSITVTPAYLNLENLQAKINTSDFNMKGNVSNYLPYFFKNETLKGNFTLTSSHINLNEFMKSSSSSAKADTSVSTASSGVLEVPRNIDVRLNTEIKELLFDQLTITNIKGGISLSDAIARLNSLSMQLLNGNMVMSGSYSTQNPQIPGVNLDLNISELDINAIYNTFSFIKKSIPIAMNCNGRISSALKFSSTLDKNMSVIMNTVNGEGSVSSKGVIINENPTMMQLASILKNEELSRLSISSLKIDFKVTNGNIKVEPFKTVLAGNPVTIYGEQSVDGKIDYTLSMNVKREFFGKEINKALSAIPGSSNIENLDIDTKITGTLSKPEVRPDLTKAISKIAKEAEKDLKEKALKGLKKLFK